MAPAAKSPSHGRQEGATLVIALVTLVPVLLLGLSAANLSLQGERAARGDRDRQIAFQAAEAALLDAEHDIEGGLDPASQRNAIFSDAGSTGFHEQCSAPDGASSGLCQPAEEGAMPVWLSIDLTEKARSANHSVPYGKFTGQTYPAGGGSLPKRPPAYIIERLPLKQPGEAADQERREVAYRITAIGFGPTEATHAVLQSIYRRAGSAAPAMQ
jgi:type IV pilus assembly protein PilX